MRLARIRSSAACRIGSVLFVAFIAGALLAGSGSFERAFAQLVFPPREKPTPRAQPVKPAQATLRRGLHRHHPGRLRSTMQAPPARRMPAQMLLALSRVSVPTRI